MSPVTAAPLLFAVLLTVQVVPVISQCSTLGQADCKLQDLRTCGWTPGTGWSIGHERNEIYTSYFLEFNGKGAGRVTSSTVCSMDSLSYCLWFRYQFLRNDVAHLDVLLNSSSTGEMLVWTMSSADNSESWNKAQAPINRTEEVNIIIEAETYRGQNCDKCVRIDDIAYNVCQLKTLPPEAIPANTSTTQYPATLTMPSSFQTTTTITTTSAAPTSAADTTKKTTTTTTVTTTSTYLKTTPYPNRSKTSKQTTDHVILTETTSPATTPFTRDQARPTTDNVTGIACAVAGVVVVVFVIVLLVVFRSKLRLFWQNCSKADQRGEHFQVVALHNTTYNLDLDDQGETTAEEETTPDPGHHSDSSVSATSPESPNPPLPTHQYASVNKPRGSNPGPQPRRTDESPPRIDSDMPASTVHLPGPSQTTSRTASNTMAAGLPSFPGRLDSDLYTLCPPVSDEPLGARITTPLASPRSVQEGRQPYMTSHDQDGDYNSLDLGGRRRVVERGEEEGEGPGQVYSGLNEGDGDTYSEVNHHRRTEVIDGLYSHFQ